MTKLESASRLIDFAVRTVLNDHDAVAAVAMVGSAAIVAENLVTAAGGKPFAEHAEPTFPFGRYNSYRAMTRESFNFVKHAMWGGDDQPGASLTFAPEDTEALLVAAITDLRHFRTCTPTEVAFITWKLATQRSKFVDDQGGFGELLPRGLEGLDRPARLYGGRILVADFCSPEPSQEARALLAFIGPRTPIVGTTAPSRNS